MSLTRRSTLGLMAGAVLAPSVLRAQSFPTKPITLVVPIRRAGRRTRSRASSRRTCRPRSARTSSSTTAPAPRAPSARGPWPRPIPTAIPSSSATTRRMQQHVPAEGAGLRRGEGFRAAGRRRRLRARLRVRNDLPAKTIKELIALAKADPGKLNYGSTGVGSGSHLAMELFMARTGIKMTHVPSGARRAGAGIVGGASTSPIRRCRVCWSRSMPARCGRWRWRARSAIRAPRTSRPCASRALPMPTPIPGRPSSRRQPCPRRSRRPCRRRSSHRSPSRLSARRSSSSASR